MPVTDVTHDLESCTLTITAEFAAPADRVWEVYADPRRLERVWGPPTYPATVVDHELAPGGRMNYYMTSPEGEKYFGFWDISEVNEPKGFSFEDGFALDETFAPNPDLPVSRNTFSFMEADGGEIHVHGSSTLAQGLAAAGLVDRHHLLTLIEHAAYSNPITLQRYDVVR